MLAPAALHRVMVALKQPSTLGQSRTRAYVSNDINETI